MSTRANIRVDAIGDKGVPIGHIDYHVPTDGGDKLLIRDTIKEVVREWQGNVKSQYLSKAVLNQLHSVAISDYAWLLPGFLVDDFVDYSWQVRIGPRGGVSIKRRR